MKKSSLFMLLATALIMPSAFADSDSPQAVCAAEADEINFENQAERDAFMEECMQQFKQEMSESGQESSAKNSSEER